MDFHPAVVTGGDGAAQAWTSAWASIAAFASSAATPSAFAIELQMTCFVPRPDAEAAQVDSQEESIAAPAFGDFDLASVQRAVQAATSQCLRKRVGYWTYEVCPFQATHQFHVENGGSADQPGGTPTSQRVLLGQYDASSVKLDTKGPAPALVHDLLPGADGRQTQLRFECGKGSLPDGVSAGIRSIKEDSTNHYRITIALSSKAVCAQLTTAESLLQPLKGSCVLKQEGWWTYRACVGGKVTQFHKDGERVSAEFVLGVFDAASPLVLDTPSARGEAEPVTEPSTAWKSTGPVSAGSLLPPALAQLYPGGTACDMTGKPRSTEVRVVCDAEDTLAFQSVQEAATCQYIVTLSSMFVCEHPELGGADSGSKAEATPLHCFRPEDIPDAPHGQPTPKPGTG